MNNKLNEEIKREERVIEQLTKLFHNITNTNIDLESKVCVTRVLYEKFKYEVIETTAKGKPSVNARTLRELKKIKGSNHIQSLLSDIVLEGKLVIKAEELTETKYPLASIILAYRRERKILNAMYSLRNRVYSEGAV